MVQRFLERLAGQQDGGAFPEAEGVVGPENRAHTRRSRTGLPSIDYYGTVSRDSREYVDIPAYISVVTHVGPVGYASRALSVGYFGMAGQSGSACLPEPL